MIDLWIMEKFDVLPTDKRFLDLFDEQKIALFEGVCSLPDHQDLKKNILITTMIDDIRKQPDSEFISSGLKITMENNFKKAGLSDTAIKKKLKHIVDINKQVKLKEWEDLQGG